MTRSKLFFVSLFCLAFSVGNLFKLEIYSPQIRLSPLDLVVFILVIYVVLTQKKNLLVFYSRFSGLYTWLGLFFFTAIISLTLALPRYGILAFIVGLLYFFRLLIYFHLFPAVSLFFSKSQIKIIILILFSLILTTSTIQYLLFPDISRLEVSEWDPHYFRVVGTLLDPGFVGLVLLWAIIYFFSKSHKLTLWSYLLMALTYSRSTFLAYMAALIAVSARIRSWRLFIFGTILMAITLVLLPRASQGEGVRLERTSSIIARITNWKNSIAIFRRYPILGVGYNTYRYAQRDMGYLSDSKWLRSHAGAGADSSLLFTAATTGLFGLVCYLFYLRRLYAVIPFRPYLIALLVHSFFLNSLYYPVILVFMAFLLALSVKPHQG